jgi:hypothetical protein
MPKATFKPHIIQVNGESMTTSLALAEHYQVPHEMVIRVIKKFTKNDDELYFNNFISHVKLIDTPDSTITFQPLFLISYLAFVCIGSELRGDSEEIWKNTCNAYVIAFAQIEEAKDKKRDQELLEKQLELDKLIAKNEKLRKELFQKFKE